MAVSSHGFIKCESFVLRIVSFYCFIKLYVSHCVTEMENFYTKELILLSHLNPILGFKLLHFMVGGIINHRKKTQLQIWN
jgi:hypothetical protein